MEGFEQYVEFTSSPEMGGCVGLVLQANISLRSQLLGEQS